MPMLVPSEQEALMQAMSNSFGSCTCRPGMHCDGHRFLGEVQMYAGELRDRVTILTMYRRFASFWTGAEFSRPFVLEPGPMLEPSPLPDLAPRESPQTGDAPERLPW